MSRTETECWLFADPKRAGEIAVLEGETFGLAEFTALTGVGVPGSGIYRVSRDGISIGPAENIGEWAPAEQHKIHQAARLLTLKFPCTPLAFMRWYNATRATNNVSDFPLVPGFAEAIQKGEERASETLRPSVPSPQIIGAFKRFPDPIKNRSWWKLRLSNPGKYALTGCRAARGKAKRPSRWYPEVVAAWLIERRFISRESVLSAMQRSFPDWDINLL